MTAQSIKFEFNENEMKEFILDCFLLHDLKLVRNWGASDPDDHLCYKDVTLLQFRSESKKTLVTLRPKQGHVEISCSSVQSSKLFHYLSEKADKLINKLHLPYFDENGNARHT